MSRFELKIFCVNPQCTKPENAVGQQICAQCSTPLIYRYLWAVEAAAKPVGSILGGGRYQVVAPQIWLDLQPGMTAYAPPQLPTEILPYLYLYPQRFHLPQVYGFCRESDREPIILLLDHTPLDDEGIPYLPMIQGWANASGVRQANWLWQMLELWEPLDIQGVAQSLLVADNLRVQDWRLRLRELQLSSPGTPEPSLKELAVFWQTLLPQARSSLAKPLKNLCADMLASHLSLDDTKATLNRILLQQASQLSLGLQVYGLTDTGRDRPHNEDACFPVGEIFQDDLLPRVSIVCDGIGGHEGGEVASNLALNTLRPQIKALMAEISEQPDIVSPEIIKGQLGAIVRVVNNVIATQNDTQDRQDRRRMGTTLVMALQIPQRIKLSNGVISPNGHELYLVNVGDSRAYWLSPRGLHQLTVDDDVAAREVRLGRAIYRDALLRPDAGALTQALGTRDSEFLRPTVQRFILEEDGVLLLCSDGLSDLNLVDRAWRKYSEPVIRGRMTLEAAATAWVKLANEQNGSDNISIVLTRCQVTAPLPNLSPNYQPQGADPETTPEAAAILEVVTALPKPKPNRVLPFFLGLVAVGSLGIIGWSQFDPMGLRATRDRIDQQLRSIFSPAPSPVSSPIPTQEPVLVPTQPPVTPLPTITPSPDSTASPTSIAPTGAEPTIVPVLPTGSPDSTPTPSLPAQ